MLKGFYHGDTPSGLARKISPDAKGKIVFVPVDRTTTFRKLAPKDAHPRPCIFEVEGWLMKTQDLKTFQEARFGVDYQ